MSSKRVLVFIEDADKKGRKAIEKSTGRVLAGYPHGILVEADEPQLKALKKEGYQVEVQNEATMIKLKAVQFDTSEQAPKSPASLTLKAADRPTDKKSGYWLIQMVGPVKPEWGKELASLGVTLGDYVPEYAFLAHMTADIADKVRGLSFVNWVGLYEPAYKVSPLLMGRRKRAIGDEIATLALKEDTYTPIPEGNLTVLVHTPSDRQKVIKAIEKAGGSVVAGEGDTIIASLDLAATPGIARMTEVKWIEPHGVRVLHNNISAQIIGVQEVWDHHVLDGDGQIVSVADSGLDTGVNDATMHDDFEGRIVSIYDLAGDGADDSGNASLHPERGYGHGTHVAGSVLGNGSRSSGSIRGMAPAAQLVFQATQRKNTGGLVIPADLNTLFQQAYNDGARIHTNSWGTHDPTGASYGQYDAGSEDIDEFMWDHKDSIILFSAGNNGTDANNDGNIDNDSVAPEGCAKNCITVGATEGNRPHGAVPAPGFDSTWGLGWPADYPSNPINNDHVSNDPEGMAAFSSRGPTDDGRPKPDVVAPGTNILSTRSSLVTGVPLWGDLPGADALHDLYCWSGGTSMSTPLTTGTVALIRQYLQRVCLHSSPSGALLKAVLIHGAVPITGQYAPAEVGAVPDNSQGWGRVNLPNSLFPEYPATWEFRDIPADAVGTGDQRDYTFPVVNTAVPFRATLAWTDFQSNPATGGSLVNQLRLSVIAPNGTVTQGNPANNNVQQVVIGTPQAGDYIVRVRGINVPTVASVGQRQDFAVVISGGLDFVEIYVKDNVSDTGIPPSFGTLYLSPDILVCLDNDPTMPAPNPEFGQTNYVFVRIHNRGPRTANNATVKLYWANPGTNLTKPFWHTDGIKVAGIDTNSQQVTVPGRTAAGEGEVVTPAFEWLPPDPDVNTHDSGHFCLFASVTHGEDPLLQEDLDGVGWDDNLAWKNVNVQNALPDTETGMDFYVAGEAGVSVMADLHIDRTELPAGGKVMLKMPSRWLTGASLSNLEKVWQSDGGLVCKQEVTSRDTADIRSIKLKPGENTLVRLDVRLPEDAVPGELYTVFVDQKVNGKPRSRVTLLARTVGTPAYIANRNTGSLEIHLSNCVWAHKISPRNKVPYDDLALALKRGFNGCKYCLPEYHTG
jgi:hypothetical protein